MKKPGPVVSKIECERCNFVAKAMEDALAVIERKGERDLAERLRTLFGLPQIRDAGPERK